MIGFTFASKFPISVLGYFIVDVFRSHKIGQSHGRPLSNSDKLVEETATYVTHSKHKRRTSIPLAGLEPAIPAI